MKYSITDAERELFRKEARQQHKKFNDEFINKSILKGLASYLLTEAKRKLTPEQRHMNEILELQHQMKLLRRRNQRLIRKIKLDQERNLEPLGS